MGDGFLAMVVLVVCRVVGMFVGGWWVQSRVTGLKPQNVENAESTLRVTWCSTQTKSDAPSTKIVLPQNWLLGDSLPAMWSNLPLTLDSSWSEYIQSPGLRASFFRLPIEEGFLTVVVVVPSGLLTCLPN